MGLWVERKRRLKMGSVNAMVLAGNERERSV